MTAKIKRNLQKLNTSIDLGSMTAVVMALNGDNLQLLRDSEDHKALVGFVKSWNTAKRNPWKMQADARFSLSNLERVWTWKLAPIGRTTETDRMVDDLEARGVRVREDVGGAYWHRSPTGENCSDIAAMLAGMLLTNPLRAKLSDGPCQRERCNKWFIKRRPDQKCCSRRCGAIVKTAERVNDKREDEKKEKLKIVRDAHREWRKSTTSLDWKMWVATRTGIDRRFLTRNFTKEGRIRIRD